jgi:hypothetical protein
VTTRSGSALDLKVLAQVLLALVAEDRDNDGQVGSGLPADLPIHGLLHRHGTGHGISGGAEGGRDAVPDRRHLLPASALDGAT